MTDNPKFNNSGYYDPTAWQSLRRDAEREKKVYDLLKAIKLMASASGFEITNRIIIQDKKTGKTWH